MKALQIRQSINLRGGGTAKVIDELGTGGQGIVYKVEHQGQLFALKWYTQNFKEPDKFYNNLLTNITEGAPSKIFLWPLILTEREQSSFGYIMNLRPSNFHDFSDFLLAKVTFKSLNAILKAALSICQAFKRLHIKGYTYLDLNDGNFFVNPQTGDILICDNDNVTFQGNDMDMVGKMRYMAPEIVLGQKPDKYSDYFSLAVMLFLFFYGNHPLEGKQTLKAPAMTEAHERKFYGSQPIFIYDPDNRENEPVRGVHSNVLRRWPIFPKLLRKKFIEAFQQDKIENTTKRLMPSDWEKVFIKLRNRLIDCPRCSKDFFGSQAQGANTCINCGQTVQVKYVLKLNQDTIIPLLPKKAIFLGSAEKPIGLVRKSKKDPSILGLQNISSDPWIVETPSGKMKKVEPQTVMPTKPGLKIKFDQSNLALIS